MLRENGEQKTNSMPSGAYSIMAELDANPIITQVIKN